MNSPVLNPSTWPQWVTLPLVFLVLAALGLILWDVWRMSWARYAWRRRRRDRR